MIVYIERDLILDDDQCHDLFLCINRNNDEYLVTSRLDTCTCSKRTAILCKYEHETCRNRLSSSELFIKQSNDDRSHSMTINDCSTNVVLFDRDELQSNAEILYAYQAENLPAVITEHLQNKFEENLIPSVVSSSTNRTIIGNFLLKHSLLAQSVHGMYRIFQEARHNRFQFRRHANWGYLFGNILVGMMCSLVLFQYFDLNRLVPAEILTQARQITTWIKSILQWLLHAPVGLKLNKPLVDFLARFYFYHIYLWSDYLEALVITVFPYLLQIFSILPVFGISLALGAIGDFVRLLTIHLFCFYLYVARLFNWQIRLLVILFRLFCGKKMNPLRNNRLDSHLCDIDQLFIVTLSFTILLFLLPSVFMYYAVFTSIWTVTVLSVKFIQYIDQHLLQIPVYELYLWLTTSNVIRGEPRLAINYNLSTECNAYFDLHFDPIMMNNGKLTLFDRYDVGRELGKGTYGIVRKAFDTRQQHDVAIKCVCLGDEGIPSTALREISLLRSLSHPNVIRLYDIQVHQPTGELFLFYECMEMDLYEYMKLYRQPLSIDLAKSYLKQMLHGIDYIHSHAMLHRDLKPQNILIDWIGSLKLADFGLGRHFQMPMRMYTHEVITLWYRSPEILLGAKTYTTSVDLWSIGTIFAEITHNRPLFAGECEIDQLFRIFRTLGTPDDTAWPAFSTMPDHKKTFPQWKPQNMSKLLSGLSSDGLELTLQMLVYDPDRRITAKAALESNYFQSMPTYLVVPPQLKTSVAISNTTT